MGLKDFIMGRRSIDSESEYFEKLRREQEYVRQQRMIVEGKLKQNNSSEIPKSTPDNYTVKTDKEGKQHVGKEEKVSDKKDVNYSKAVDNKKAVLPDKRVIDSPKTADNGRIRQRDLGNDFGDWPNYFFAPKRVYKEKKNVIIFSLENTSMVNEHKTEILGLVKKIVQDNKDTFYLFLKSGNDKKFFDLMDYETFCKDKILDDLLVSNENNEDKVDLLEVLKYIEDFFNLQMTLSLDGFKYKDKKYDIQNINIIFVGTATYSGEEDSKRSIIEKVKNIKTNLYVKRMKYFCMEDKETINAAMLGFPIIGHIVSDFYK